MILSSENFMSSCIFKHMVKSEVKVLTEQFAKISASNFLRNGPNLSPSVAAKHSWLQQEIRKREHYEKPSVKRKKKSEAARKKNRQF